MALLLSTLLLAALPADEAELKLAQSLAWAKHFDEAAMHYRAVLRRSPQNVEARKGLATVEYWSGDFRSAQRDFRIVLQARPNDADARRVLAEIASTMRPVATSDAAFSDDDQPLQRASASASYTIFSDPLTTWTARAGTYVGESRTMPFAGIGGSSVLGRYRAEGSLRVLKFPDGTTRPLGNVAISRGAFRLDVDRSELLYTKSAYRSHPFATTASLGWKRGTTSAAAIHLINYYDHNHGFAADAFHLVPITKSLFLGGSASYRDTDQSRFIAGRYDPYWTPRKLTDLRAVAAATTHAGSATINLHADAGWARDDEVGTFHPWRVSADCSYPLRSGATITGGVEEQSTAFYRATTVHVGLAWRAGL